MISISTKNYFILHMWHQKWDQQHIANRNTIQIWIKFLIPLKFACTMPRISFDNRHWTVFNRFFFVRKKKNFMNMKWPGSFDFYYLYILLLNLWIRLDCSAKISTFSHKQKNKFFIHRFESNMTCDFFMMIMRHNACLKVDLEFFYADYLSFVFCLSYCELCLYSLFYVHNIVYLNCYYNWPFESSLSFFYILGSFRFDVNYFIRG